MNRPLSPALFVSAATVAGVVSVISCASKEDLKKRQDKRTRSYENVQDRRAIRAEGRQERTDMWF